MTVILNYLLSSIKSCLFQTKVEEKTCLCPYKKVISMLACDFIQLLHFGPTVFELYINNKKKEKKRKDAAGMISQGRANSDIGGRGFSRRVHGTNEVFSYASAASTRLKTLLRKAASFHMMKKKRKK